MANRFVLNNISYHGKGAIAEVPGEIQRRGYKKAFVASDPDLVKFGVTAKVTDLLDAAGIEWELFSEIKPNPTIKNVQDGVAAFQASGADCIVAVGGGSAMDTAKGIGIIATNPEFADVVSLEGVAPTKNHAVFTIAVATTAATGAGSSSQIASASSSLPESSTLITPLRKSCTLICASSARVTPTESSFLPSTITKQ